MRGRRGLGGLFTGGGGNFQGEGENPPGFYFYAKVKDKNLQLDDRVLDSLFEFSIYIYFPPP